MPEPYEVVDDAESSPGTQTDMVIVAATPDATDSALFTTSYTLVFDHEPRVGRSAAAQIEPNASVDGQAPDVSDVRLIPASEVKPEDLGMLSLRYVDGTPVLVVSSGTALPAGLTVLDASGNAVAVYAARPSLEARSSFNSDLTGGLNLDSTSAVGGRRGLLDIQVPDYKIDDVIQASSG
ncbi:hypothetical protein [Streptomyces sp. NPDC091268]|uniref:hypothetical protein n=1 Tax=Streptomyces sp. NPDC091268 TaxID=3365979 RepID=UPI00382C76A1